MTQNERDGSQMREALEEIRDKAATMTNGGSWASGLAMLCLGTLKSSPSASAQDGGDALRDEISEIIANNVTTEEWFDQKTWHSRVTDCGPAAEEIMRHLRLYSSVTDEMIDAAMEAMEKSPSGNRRERFAVALTAALRRSRPSPATGDKSWSTKSTATTEPAWARCPSTHCERRQECASPSECSAAHQSLASDLKDTQPTPEPWEVSVWDRNVFVGGGPNNDDIAEFNFCDEATVKITKEEAIANAYLFASAPALKRQSEHWERLQAVADTGTAENFLALSDEDKRQFFAIAIDESSRRKAAELELATLRADLDAKPPSPAQEVNAELVAALKRATPLVRKWCFTQGNTTALLNQYVVPIERALAAAERQQPRGESAMRSRLNITLALEAIAMSALDSAPVFDIEPLRSAQNRSVNRKSGNTPVPGAGAKERAKRLKRIQQAAKRGEE